MTCEDSTRGGFFAWVSIYTYEDNLLENQELCRYPPTCRWVRLPSRPDFGSQGQDGIRIWILALSHGDGLPVRSILDEVPQHFAAKQFGPKNLAPLKDLITDQWFC